MSISQKKSISLHNHIFIINLFVIDFQSYLTLRMSRGLFNGITYDTVTYPAGSIKAKVFLLQAYRHKQVTCKLFYRIFNNVKICNTAF